MILTEMRYRAERGKTEATYQGFSATVEMEPGRRFIRIELDNTTRWRSCREYAEYLRWAAREIESLEKEIACSPAKK